MDIYTNYIGTKYRSIRIRNEAPFKPCARIGGFPPAGITVPVVSGYERYFLTLPLTERLCVSVFLAMSYDDSCSKYDFFKSELTHCFHDENVSLVKFMLHDILSTGFENTMASEIPPLFLVQEGPPANDPIITNRQDIYTDELCRDHKTGGTPWYRHQPDDFVLESLQILNKGYKHILQLCFPHGEDVLFNANWPFGDYIFHIFGKPNSDETQWTFLYSWG